MQGSDDCRYQRVSTYALMTAKEISQYLIQNCKTLRFYDAYMFGSTLNGVGHDIDLLFVGPSGSTLSALKKEIQLVEKELPLDVLYMQPIEAVETNFVKNEGCVLLSNLASLNY